jgi:Raf kinase inhibitor-like YbhB/YbcL family protein
MTITSEAVMADGTVAEAYTCDGANISPPLTFSDIPDGTQSLALIVDDPDAPGGIFTHWLYFDMSPATLQIVENSKPMTGTAGINSFGTLDYAGPCPPAGTHRYFFKLYALDAMLELPEGVSREELLQSVEQHTIEQAGLVGTYAKQSRDDA